MKLKEYLFLLTISLIIALPRSSSHRIRRLKSSSKSNLLDFFADIVHIADSSYSEDKFDKNWEVLKTLTFDNIKSEAIVLANKKKNKIGVGIRGTVIKSYSDIKNDIKKKKMKYAFCEACEVHSLFYKHTTYIQYKLDQAIDDALKVVKNPEFIITGHSISGAVATLYLNHLLQKYGNRFRNKVKLVTFGSPRVGNKEFALFTNSKIGTKNIFRVTYKNDPVTYIPLMKNGYHHIGTKKYEFDNYSHYEKNYKSDRDSIKFWNHVKIENHVEYMNIKNVRRYSSFLQKSFSIKN